MAAATPTTPPEPPQLAALLDELQAQRVLLSALSSRLAELSERVTGVAAPALPSRARSRLPAPPVTGEEAVAEVPAGVALSGVLQWPCVPSWD